MVLAFAGLLFAAIELRSLRAEIDEKFATGLWPVPTKIYSAPLVLRAGSRLRAAQLVDRLVQMGYREIPETPRDPGQFHRSGSSIELHTRGFELPGRRLEGMIARVDFAAAGGVIGLSGVSSSGPGWRALSRVELEPTVLATLYGPEREERIALPLKDFPQSLIEAVIASEDRRFFDHHGLDPIRIAGAALANLRAGGVVEGGSTISQQTVKNLFLTSDRTMLRKVREALLATMLEATRTKEQILETYLNEIYLGQRASVAVCGFGEASRFYFGKDVADLDLSEAATLVGLIPAPGEYNPFLHADRAKSRRNIVLGALLAQGKITPEEEKAALARPIVLAGGSGRSAAAPWFVQLVRSQLAEKYPEATLTAGGLRVFTSLDPFLQQAAEEAVRAGLARLEKERKGLVRRGRDPLEACLVTIRPETGEILALVGGRDFSRSQFDRVTQARRQPGSAFKPFVYLAGLQRAAKDHDFSFTPLTVLDDSPLELVSGGKVWRPANDDNTFRGPVTVRQALEQSLNVPTVRAAESIGLDEIVATARRCGIATPLQPLPSLALGAQELAPIELAVAYCTLANGGEHLAPTAIRDVTGENLEPIARPTGARRRSVDAAAAWLTIDLMRGVLDRGTAHSVREAGITGDYAGKTGTTNDRRDSWFVGVSPDLVDVVWTGFDDNGPTGLAGSTGALPIWIDYVQRTRRSTGTRPFPEPEGLVRAVVDPATGGLATDRCPQQVEEIFIEGTEPNEECSEHAPGFGNWLRRLFGHDRESAPPGARIPPEPRPGAGEPL